MLVWDANTRTKIWRRFEIQKPAMHETTVF